MSIENVENSKTPRLVKLCMFFLVYGSMLLLIYLPGYLFPELLESPTSGVSTVLAITSFVISFIIADYTKHAIFAILVMLALLVFIIWHHGKPVNGFATNFYSKHQIEVNKEVAATTLSLENFRGEVEKIKSPDFRMELSSFSDEEAVKLTNSINEFMKACFDGYDEIKDSRIIASCDQLREIYDGSGK